MRGIAGDLPFLVPGVGVQGGDVGAACGPARPARHRPLVSTSRDVLYASPGDDFAEAARGAQREPSAHAGLDAPLPLRLARD